MAAAIHDGVTSTLLVPAPTPLGVAWRHRLMRDAVRDLLLPLEQQAMARRAADHLNRDDSDLNDGQLRQAATLYEMPGTRARLPGCWFAPPEPRYEPAD